MAALLRPVHRGCRRLATGITWHVRANGVHIHSSEFDLKFPRDVGLMYSSIMWWEGVNAYEPSTWRVIRSGVERAGAFLDVGSNVGLYAVLARKVRPGIPVDAFEPVPSLAEGNRKFQAANGFPVDTVHEAAVSDRVGMATLSVPQYTGGREAEPTASLTDNSTLSPGADYRSIAVPTFTLDAFLAEHSRPDPLFIKVDVEGHELAALQGAEQTLRTRRPWLVVEMLNQTERNVQVHAYAVSMNYVLFGICKEGLFRMGESDFREPRPFTDFLFIPEESVPANALYLSYQTLCRLLEEKRV